MVATGLAFPLAPPFLSSQNRLNSDVVFAKLSSFVLLSSASSVQNVSLTSAVSFGVAVMTSYIEEVLYLQWKMK